MIITTNPSVKAIACCLLFWFGSAIADDTEIYVKDAASQAPTKQPNVLMILDSSGSMAWKVAGPPYDPNTTYVGTVKNDRLYVYRNYTGGLARGNVHSIPLDRNRCTSATAYFNSEAGKLNPVYEDKFSVYRQKSSYKRGWMYQLNAYTGDNNVIECKKDRETEQGNYPRKGAYVKYSSRYTNDIDDSINWDGKNDNNVDYAKTYKLVTDNYHRYVEWVKTLPDLDIRTEVMKETATNLVDDSEGLNIGLMRFNGSSHGGYVISDFLDVSVDANKEALKGVINDIPAGGGTPLAETMSEAARFYRGEKVSYGKDNNYKSVSASRSSDTTRYKTPIVDACQKNYVVLLTDGVPESDNGADDDINTRSALTGDDKCKSVSKATTPGQSCLDEAAKWLYETDHSTSSLGTNLAGKQNIVTYMIGFNIEAAKPLIDATALAGGGKSYAANSANELKTVFEDIFARIVASDGSFAAPSVTVNAFNRLRHREDMYYAAFRPKETDNWQGNVKKFTITSGGKILDKDRAVAVDGATGQFKESSTSLWVTDGQPDGISVEAGGFADQLPAERKLYTSIDGSTDDGAIDLTLPSSRVRESNTGLTTELLGAGVDPDKRKMVLDWANDKFVADPLHSTPVVISYGATEASPDDVVYAMTNLGFLHALNGETGEEYFAYIPQALLPNLTSYYDEEVLSSGNNSNKTYGLDGPISAWIDNPVGAVTSEDRVNLFLAMRRGGGNYYALDVTDKSAPKLKWVIKGGEGDFAKLAQTWSTAKKAKIRWWCDDEPTTKGTTKCYRDVLIFSGGYDTVHDQATAATSEDKGAAVYIVDAETGERLWMAGDGVGNAGLSLDMQNSIAADVSIIDFDADGFIDSAYAVDILGKVWRFDFKKNLPNKVKNLVTGGLIADLGGSFNDGGGNAQVRRFYYAPDISLQGEYLAISVGSGYRAHPLETTVNDRLYVLFDRFVGTSPNNPDDQTKRYNYVGDFESIITESDLKDVSVASSAFVTEADIAEANDVFANASQEAASARQDADDKQKIVDTANAEHAVDNTNPAATNAQIQAAEAADALATEKEALAAEKQALIPREENDSSASYTGGDLYGWYMDLPGHGEKILAETTIYGGNVYFTSYIPPGQGSQSCTPGIGSGRLYARNITSGETGYSDGVSYIDLASAGIPSEAAVIYTKDTSGSGDTEKTTSKPIVCVGTECQDVIGESPLKRSYWEEQ